MIMNLLQQLQAANMSRPPSGPAKNMNTARKQSQNQIDNIYKAHEKHTNKAIDRYRAAMIGKGWMTTAKVEMAIGCAATTANPFLRKLFNELKLIERRPRDGKPYNRRAGWEWRWTTNKEE